MNINLQQDPATGKYILYFDASLYKSSACLRRVYYTLFRGLRREGKDFKMEFGTATHRFLQAWYGGRPVEDCLKLATDYYAPIPVPDSDFRHIGQLVNVCMGYHKQYGGGADMLKPVSPEALECKFAYPLYFTPRVEVLLCGTIDMIGVLNGRKVIVDHKTTSIMGTESYLNSYQLSPQLMVYKLIYQKLFGQTDDIGCLINGIFISKSGKTKFERSMIFEYTSKQIHNLEFHVMETVKNIVKGFELLLDNPDMKDVGDVAFPNAYTCCTEQWGMCQFNHICLMDSDDDKESIISNEFVSRTYEPLNFQ